MPPSRRFLFEEKRIVTRNAPEKYKDFRETGSRKRFEIQSSGHAMSKGCLILLFSGAPFNGIHFTGSSVIFLFHSMRFLLSLSYTKLEAVSDNLVVAV